MSRTQEELDARMDSKITRRKLLETLDVTIKAVDLQVDEGAAREGALTALRALRKAFE